MRVGNIVTYKANPCQPLKFGSTNSADKTNESKKPEDDDILYLYQAALDNARQQAFINQAKFTMACAIAAAQAQQYNDLVASTQNCAD